MTVVSLLVARLFQLPEAYWAPITSLVVSQSSFGAALPVWWHRFVGTVVGGVLGGIVAKYFGPDVVVFSLSVFILGLLCAVLVRDVNAYRFGGVTLVIVVFIPHAEPAWQIAFHRIAEVSIGIGVALIFAWIWPEKLPLPAL